MKIRYLVLTGTILLLSLAGVVVAPAAEPINSRGWSPLYEAVVFEDIRQVKKLIKAGADVNFQTPRRARYPGRTPLHVAAYKGNHRITRLLLEAGADPNLVQADGRTSLHEAVIEPAKVEVAKLLLAAGADPTIPEKNGITPLLAVSGQPHPKFTRNHSHPELYALMLEHLGPLSDRYVLPCYRVQRSDTRLSIVAEKTLGDGSRWTEIAELNNLSQENPYRVGDCLKLPNE